MHRRFFVSIVLVLIPAMAGAEQLKSGVGSAVLWTDNAFETAEDVTSDTYFRISPWADVMDDEGRVTWGLRYAPLYEYYIDQEGLRGFDHDVTGRLAWRVGERTMFRMSDRFQRYHGVSSFNELAGPGEDIIPVGSRQRFKLNTINASLEHALGPRDLLSFSAYQSLYGFADEEQLDHEFFGVNLAYDHTLSARASVGTRLSWGRQTLENLNVSDTVTDYYNLSGVLTYALSPTSNLSLSAGPALIQGDSGDFEPPDSLTTVRFPLRRESDGIHFFDASTCPEDELGNFILSSACETTGPGFTDNEIAVFESVIGGNQTDLDFAGAIPRVDGSNTTYFASVTFSKRWDRWGGVLGYTRSAGQSTAVASVSDIVYGNLNWRIAQRWTADLGASFQQREQASENAVLGVIVTNTQLTPELLVAETREFRAVVLDSDTGVDLLRVQLRVAYQLSPRASLYARTDYSEQSGTGGASSFPGVDRLALSVGLDYSFSSVNF